MCISKYYLNVDVFFCSFSHQKENPKVQMKLRNGLSSSRIKICAFEIEKEYMFCISELFRCHFHSIARSVLISISFPSLRLFFSYNLFFHMIFFGIFFHWVDSFVKWTWQKFFLYSVRYNWAFWNLTHLFRTEWCNKRHLEGITVRM